MSGAAAGQPGATESARARRDRLGPAVTAPYLGWAAAAAALAGLDASAGARVVAGVALVFITARLFRRQPSLAVTLPALLAAASALAIAQRLYSGAWPASGGYFVMSACAAAGMACREPRQALWWLAGAAAALCAWWAGPAGAADGAALSGGIARLAAVLLALWIATALVRAARALARTPRDTRLLGVTAGVVVFALACAAGRASLLRPEAFAFWIQCGVMMSLAGSTLVGPAVTAASPATSSTREPAIRR